jgi:hypothetical protein
MVDRDKAEEWQKAHGWARQGTHCAAFAPYSLANGAHVLAKVGNSNFESILWQIVKKS